jgi:hypothetical protein
LPALTGDDQTFTHGKQHRLVMLVMTGDDGRFQPTSLPMYPVCDQQRSGSSHREGNFGRCCDRNVDCDHEEQKVVLAVGDDAGCDAARRPR